MGGLKNPQQTGHSGEDGLSVTFPSLFCYILKVFQSENVFVYYSHN